MSNVEALSTSRISQVKNDVNTSDKSFAGGKSFTEKLGRAFRRAAHTTKQVALVAFGPALMAAGMWIACNYGEMCGTEKSVSRREANANMICTVTATAGVLGTAIGIGLVQCSPSFEEKEEERTIHIKKAMEMAKTKQR